MSKTPIRYDLELFLALNAEYEARRVHANPPPIKDDAARLARKQRTARNIAKQVARYVDIRGKSVLDFGCGRGDLDMVLAEHLDCQVTGVDVMEYPEWAELQHPKIRRLVLDLTEEGSARQLTAEFDVVVSNSVLEHVRHPYRALQGIRTVLRGGVAWLKINLYRGPLASHCYRDVYFPWPHLLFTDEVFRQFFQYLGKRPRGASWVNKLTHLHCRDYFKRVGFEVLDESFSTTQIDEDFYLRFEEILGRYPRSDLEKDFLNVVLRPV